MFVLRDTHVEALRASLLETLAERCAAHLREHVEWAVYRIPDAILMRMVRWSIRRARRAGVGMDTAIVGYVHLAFVVAPNFDEHPLVRRVVERPGMDPNEIPSVLGDSLSPQDWREVRASSDSRAWGLDEADEGDGP